MSRSTPPQEILTDLIRRSSDELTKVRLAVANTDDVNRAEILDLQNEHGISLAMAPYQIVYSAHPVAARDDTFLRIIREYNDKWQALIDKLNAILQGDNHVYRLRIAQQNAHGLFERILFDADAGTGQSEMTALTLALSETAATLRDAIANNADKLLRQSDKAEVMAEVKSTHGLLSRVWTFLRRKSPPKDNDCNTSARYEGLDCITNICHQSQIRAAIDFSHEGFAVHPPIANGTTPSPTFTDLAREVWKQNPNWVKVKDSYQTEREYAAALQNHYHKHPKAFLTYTK